jgi:hypothetical protein
VSSPVAAAEVIGTSAEGRPLVARRFGPADAALRLLVVAGQHGDEPWGRAASARLGTSLTIDAALTGAELAVVVIDNVNPDGARRGTRGNAAGNDLNRDHQLLATPEIRALHAFARAFRPQLVIDVHNYPYRRKSLLARDLVFACEVFVDVPTHPAVTERWGTATRDRLLTTLQAQLRRAGAGGDRYVRVKASGRVRHSTADAVDARNALALACDAFSVLLEGRAPIAGDAPGGGARTIASQHRALLAVLAWARGHAHLLTAAPADTPTVPVNCDYRDTESGVTVACLDARTGSPVAARFERYAPDIEITTSVTVPAAYAIPVGLREVRTVLRRHGFAAEARPGFEGYEIFPTSKRGRWLTVLLDPRSRYGLHRHPGLGLDDPSAIIRIEPTGIEGASAS